MYLHYIKYCIRYKEANWRYTFSIDFWTSVNKFSDNSYSWYLQFLENEYLATKYFIFLKVLFIEKCNKLQVSLNLYNEL